MRGLSRGYETKMSLNGINWDLAACDNAKFEMISAVNLDSEAPFSLIGNTCSCHEIMAQK